MSAMGLGQSNRLHLARAAGPEAAKTETRNSKFETNPKSEVRINGEQTRYGLIEIVLV
jgi:hypothetical protein